MTVATRLPSILNEVGITRDQLIKALAESTVVREGVINKTKRVRDYWVEILPIMERPDHPIGKDSDVIIHQGDAKASLKIKYSHDRGVLTGVVFCDEKVAPHMHWLEYGSIRNPVHGYMEKVVAHFEGVESI